MSDRAPRRRRARGTKRNGEAAGKASLFALAPVLFLALFGGVPIVFSLLLVLGHLGGPNAAVSELGQNESVGHGIGTLGAIRNVFDNSAFGEDVLATVGVLALSAVIVVVGGATLTIWHRLRPSRATAILQFIAVVPLFIPVVIASFALWTFWGDRGFANSLSALAGVPHGLIFSSSLKGVVLAEVWVSLPFAVLLFRAGLATLSERSLDAARDAGAGQLALARRIVVPQLRRELMVVLCFTAVGVLGSFTVPYIIGPAKPLLLGVDAVNTFTGYNEPQQAAVIGFTIFVLAAVVGCIYAIGMRRVRVGPR